MSQVEFWQGSDQEASPAWLRTANGVFTDAPLSDELAGKMEALQWLHVTRGGVYPFLTPQIKSRPIAVTGSKGIHGPRFAEFGLALILVLAKKIAESLSAKGERRWEELGAEEISGKTLGIVGLGTIGSELARRGKPLGLRVIATKRHTGLKPDYVDELWSPEELKRLLSQSDFVVVTLPSVPATQGILGEEELRCMKRTAYLINLTQGKAVEERLLARALREGWIAGAAFDALPRQPLPEDSELWTLPNLMITPRLAGVGSPMWERVLPIFMDNLRRFLAGEELRNLVDKEVGY